MRWSFVYALMWLLGIPTPLLRLWISSVSRIERVWLINGQVCPGSHCTTGFPEGDVWSVIAMVSVACYWTLCVRHSFCGAGHPGADLTLSAYADNWAWLVSQPIQHVCVWKSTLDFLDQAGLELDFEKTWFWTWDPFEVDAIRNLVAPVLPGIQLAWKSCSSDLGFQLQYSGGFRKGVQLERFEKGMARLS